ncbi:hypothetical protein L211DRAFT_883842 [Terfezia boudieri ATCC MYA-4762]|uniref:Uncharacterized protein n=1 Tax=Terfezia boudieri ATCC MYA-4762 TaxID=1051890 RepID=A0A3N4L558_9PEZI|nr:hypothetical protein L211DRAFT_883842 [Terfezia boudieri ATCC MYA-4762]
MVDNWDRIEEKLSKRGLCALVKITQDIFLVTEITDFKVNGLEELTEVTIEFRDGEKRLVRTEKEKEKILKEQKPDPTDKSKKIEEFKGDYIYYIHNPDITNEIKKHEVFQTQNTKEREQLHADYEKLFSELRRILGIRHLTSKKEERQNNPEIELNEAQFIALERRKKRIREKTIKEAVSKGFCNGKHTLTYGTAPETREEKALEAQELQEIEHSTEALPTIFAGYTVKMKDKQIKLEKEIQAVEKVNGKEKQDIKDLQARIKDLETKLERRTRF